jgi:hypothetical protein
MKFKDYLKAELEKPVHDYYDPNGNSPRAIVVRGVFQQIIEKYQDYPNLFKQCLANFNWLQTPIGAIMVLPILIILSPIIPIIAGVVCHRSAINEFKLEFKQSILKDKNYE